MHNSAESHGTVGRSRMHKCKMRRALGPCPRRLQARCFILRHPVGAPRLSTHLRGLLKRRTPPLRYFRWPSIAINLVSSLCRGRHHQHYEGKEASLPRGCKRWEDSRKRQDRSHSIGWPEAWRQIRETHPCPPGGRWDASQARDSQAH